MAELPRYPDTDDPTVPHARRRSSKARPGAAYVMAMVVVIVVFGIVVLHLAGVIGPGAH